ncbi:hypothetical protein [Desulfoluna spongiiphila]|uniref:hypothetical protein n=1 Tax=Desulfoluna spongiiphila TaxID=419481 RepID=UPI00125F762D|nr:hypothetical protein [Desulfoluna spongiiphila]
MRLFVKHRVKDKKIYLKQLAYNRSQLLEIIGSRQFKLEGESYTIEEVFAEKGDDNNSVLGALAGGAIGLAGGLPWLLAAAAIGSFIGKNSDEKEIQKVEFFNGSSI